MAVEFIAIDRDTPYLLPPSVQDYVPQDHLARFVVEIVEQLDLRTISLGCFKAINFDRHFQDQAAGALLQGISEGR
ncbi:MAG TPA: hypothetical protein ENG77_00105 [Chromatiales bacterium]|nr:hypothetical protein [Chromatiales bacterium]